MTWSGIEQSPMAIFLLISLAILVAVLVALPVTNIVSQAMANFLSFFSRAQFNKPPPQLSQGDALIMRGDVHGAFHVFRQFLKEHPRDLEVYSRLIDLAFGPLQDAGLGDAIIAYGVKRLDRRGRRVIKQRRNAIVLGQLYPFKHLGWRDKVEYVHSQVELSREERGQFAKDE